MISYEVITPLGLLGSSQTTTVHLRPCTYSGGPGPDWEKREAISADYQELTYDIAVLVVHVCTTMHIFSIQKRLNYHVQ